MYRYLLDSNIISEPARPQPDARIQERLQQVQHEVAMPSIVWHELVHGLERLPEGRRRDYLFHYLAEVVYPSIPILSYDEEAAAWHGRERARLEALGRSNPFADGMIAAIAVTQNLILVTGTLRDFADFDGLHLENWFDG